MDKFDIPEELNAEIKFTKLLSLFDVLFIIIGLVIAWLLSPLVYTKLIVFYYIFVALSCVFLTCKSRKNPGKRNFQTIALAWKRNKQAYSRYESSHK